MFGEKAYNLIKELARNEGTLPLYNSEAVDQITYEINQLNDENTQFLYDGDPRKFSAVKLRDAAVERNKRCLKAYHYNRLHSLRNMRWDFGNVLPEDVKFNLTSAELEWFMNYSKLLGSYMKSIGLNLGVNLRPPKDLYIEVMCLTDYGRFQLADDTVILLKKNRRHYLPRAECEELIRQGVLKHIL